MRAFESLGGNLHRLHELGDALLLEAALRCDERAEVPEPVHNLVHFPVAVQRCIQRPCRLEGRKRLPITLQVLAASRNAVNKSARTHARTHAFHPSRLEGEQSKRTEATEGEGGRRRKREGMEYALTIRRRS